MRAAGGHTKIFAALILIATLSPIGSAPIAGSNDGLAKLDRRLRERAQLSNGRSRVIVRAVAGMSVPGIAPIIQQAGATSDARCPASGAMPPSFPTRCSSPRRQPVRRLPVARSRRIGTENAPARRSARPPCGRSSATTGRASASR